MRPFGKPPPGCSRCARSSYSGRIAQVARGPTSSCSSARSVSSTSIATCFNPSCRLLASGVLRRCRVFGDDGDELVGCGADSGDVVVAGGLAEAAVATEGDETACDCWAAVVAVALSGDGDGRGRRCDDVTDRRRVPQGVEGRVGKTYGAAGGPGGPPPRDQCARKAGYRQGTGQGPAATLYVVAELVIVPWEVG